MKVSHNRTIPAINSCGRLLNSLHGSWWTILVPGFDCDSSDEHGSDRARQQLNQNPVCLAGDSSGLIERLQVADALCLRVGSLEFRAN